jgi:beta-1,4-N-acetylglucosaminyltransferase
VIFVTVGSAQYPFDRLMSALNQFSVRDLIVQHGPAAAPRDVKEAYRWLTFDQVLRFMGEAETVIGHAGAGTILCAANMGHIPVVMPRLKRLGEAVDDHQVELAMAFERTERVTVVWDATTLSDRVSQSSKPSPPFKSSDLGLQVAVRAALRGAQR